MEPSATGAEPAVASAAIRPPSLIAAVILAAGASTRMGSAKSMLPFGRATFSRSILKAFIRCRIRRPIIVVGHEPGALIAHLCDLGPQFVYNRRWPLGQLSSLQAALKALPCGATGVMVSLIDQPGIRPSTIRAMIREHSRRPHHILVASYRRRSGHPVLFPELFFQELIDTPPRRGARAVIRKHIRSRVFVNTSDPAVIRDIDTPSDAAAIRSVYLKLTN